MLKRYFHSFGFKIVLVTVTTIIILFPASAMLNLSRQNQVMIQNVNTLEGLMRENLRTQAVSLTENMVTTFRNAILGMDFTFLKVSVDTIMKNDPTIVYGIILHQSGVELVTRIKLPIRDNLAAEEQLERRITLVDRTRIENVEIAGEPILEVASPVIIAAQTWGTIMFGFSQSPLNRKLADIRRQLNEERRRATIRALFTTVIFLLIGFASSVIAGRRVSRPIQELTRGAKAIGRGNLDLEITVSSRGEIGLLAGSFNQMARDLKALMAEAAEKKRMEIELATAKTIQRFIIPRGTPHMAGLEFAGMLETSSEIGGDFYDYFALDGNGRVGMIVGDVSGHGVAAGLIVAAIKSALLVEAGKVEAVPSLMDMLNRVVYHVARQELLTTCFLGVYDAVTREFTYVNAGHTFPYFFSRRLNRLTELEESNFPLGLSLSTTYVQKMILLEPADILVLYTDGLIETTNRAGEAYDYDRFERSILDNVDASAVDLRNALLQNAFSFYSGKAIDDDISLLVVRPVAQPE